MTISLRSPKFFRYIRNFPQTNHVHLRASLIEGTEETSTANTCRADEQRRAFFGGGAVAELELYKQILEIHILLLKEGDAARQAKEARLAQVNRYLPVLIGIRNTYEQVVDQFRSHPSNVYNIQLRPRAQDNLSKVVKPVFTIHRGNDSRGTPLSALFNEMHRVFPRLDLSKTDLATQILQALPQNPTFDDIKETLKQKCEERFKSWGMNIDLESGYPLTLKSIDSVADLATLILDNKPYLIKTRNENENENEYYIWGYKDNKWQRTLIDGAMVTLKWEDDAVVFVSPKDDIFKTLKKGHSSAVYDGRFENYFKSKNPPEAATLDKQHIDEYMGFNRYTTPDEYLDALLDIWVSARNNVWVLGPVSPFYLETAADKATTAERLSILTQFYLGVMTACCHMKGLSDANFGEILDGSPELSKALIKAISEALEGAKEVEQAIFTFIDAHQHTFRLSKPLTMTDKEDIVRLFNTTYRSVSATKENVHRDDYLIRDTEARGKDAPVEWHDGMMCTDFANLIPFSGLNLSESDQTYFNDIREEASTHPELVSPKDEFNVTVDIELEALMAKMEERPDLPWREVLPDETYQACRTLPAFAAREFLDAIAKGKQAEANAMLEAAEDKQALLRASGYYTDYSGRTFKSTAYEQVWWNKDTHMRRMLESHMNDGSDEANETKRQMLEKINVIDYGSETESPGLAYTQHGVKYKNAHYDASFILKNLTLEEFRHLKAIMGQTHEKLNLATEENYHKISFTAREYDALKTQLAQKKMWSFMAGCSAYFQFLCYLTYPVYFILSFFITSPAETLSNKLQQNFDFKSLILALEHYVKNYDKWNWDEREAAWLLVGMAQRDVPAHWAQEHCRLDRSFDPCPTFDEPTLPRVLDVITVITNIRGWFPLPAAGGPGFDFGYYRPAGCGDSCWPRASPGRLGVLVALAACGRLDEVRIDDLTQSRNFLEAATNRLGLLR